MMDKLVAEFPEQLRRAVAIGKNIQLRPLKTVPTHVIVAGMGGSGIGANFVAAMVQADLSIPYLVCKGYELPQFVGKNSLFIASSYSGNTEETLLCLQTAYERGAHIICIASGGKIIDFAREHDIDYILLPNEGAPPRACLGFSLVQQIAILQQLGFISDEYTQDILNSALLLEAEQEDIQRKAKLSATGLLGKLPVVYACERMEVAAVRLRQQLNENAKILCLHHSIPEMNHNELVGWREQGLETAALFFRANSDHRRNQARTSINREIISHFCKTIIDIPCKGSTFAQQALYATHFGDWLSVYLADMRGVNSMEVRVIDYLKNELAAI